MTLETILTNIKTVLEGASGIGSVYKQEKYIFSEKQFKDKFVSNSKINFWWLTRRGCREEIDSLGIRNTRWHRILITGYYGLKDADASEATYRALVEAVITALRNNNSLSGAAEQCKAPQLITSRPATIYGHLCHKAEIELEVQEFIDYSYS